MSRKKCYLRSLAFYVPTGAMVFVSGNLTAGLVMTAIGTVMGFVMGEHAYRERLKKKMWMHIK